MTCIIPFNVLFFVRRDYLFQTITLSICGTSPYILFTISNIFPRDIMLLNFNYLQVLILLKSFSFIDIEVSKIRPSRSILESVTYLLRQWVLLFKVEYNSIRCLWWVSNSVICKWLLEKMWINSNTNENILRVRGTGLFHNAVKCRSL